MTVARWIQQSASAAYLQNSLRPENLWVPRGFWRLVWPVLPYENRDAEVPEQGCLCHSEIQSATAAAADSAELSTASGGRRSRRTPDRRGGQLVSVAQFVCQTPTNSPEEPVYSMARHERCLSSVCPEGVR